MRRVLFLAHRIPYPPNKGDKIRAWHILQHLAGKAQVDLAAFVDDPADWRHAETVRAVCAETCLVPLRPLVGKARGLGGLLAGRSVTTGYFGSAAMRRWVYARLATRRYDLVFAYSSAMGAYLPVDRPGRPPVVMDFVDVDSAKWGEYAAATGGPLRWLYAREDRLLAREESRIAQACDAALFATEDEAVLFQHRAPEVADRVYSVQNGVDTERFAPGMAGEDPYAPGGPVVVFTGMMDYRPNVEAVTWFADHVLPALRQAHAGTRFCIAGARPSPAVRALGRREGVMVTGAQPDLRPYLGHAAVAVAPMRVGRGIQNKVLEALSMGVATVASPDAFRGVEAVAGRDLLVADTPACWVETLAGLLGDPDRRMSLGEGGRAQMVRRYPWPVRLAELDRLLETVSGEREEPAPAHTMGSRA